MPPTWCSSPTTEWRAGTRERAPSGAGWVLDIPITNTGPACVRPQGDIVITNANGDAVVTAPVEMGSVYEGNTTSIRVSLPQQLPLADYLVSVNLVAEATGATASIDQVLAIIVEPEEAGAARIFVVDSVAITPNAELVQYAEVSATIVNRGQTIPTPTVTLSVQRDGEAVESYPLSQSRRPLVTIAECGDGENPAYTGDSRQSETRYDLSSLPADARRLNTVVRTHWTIENQLHWVLDVVFDQDRSRIRKGYADQNVAALRRLAISLLTRDT